MNPLNWFDRAWLYATGYHGVDIIDENPDDRGMYLPNYINKEASEYVYPVTDPYTQDINNTLRDALDDVEKATGMKKEYEIDPEVEQLS